jgi:hypothetical protein
MKPKEPSKGQVETLTTALDESLEELDARSDESYKTNNVNDAFENIQEKLFQIIESEDVCDAFDLNEKFLS